MGKSGGACFRTLHQASRIWSSTSLPCKQGIEEGPSSKPVPTGQWLTLTGPTHSPSALGEPALTVSLPLGVMTPSSIVSMTLLTYPVASALHLLGQFRGVV